MASSFVSNSNVLLKANSSLHSLWEANKKLRGFAAKGVHTYASNVKWICPPLSFIKLNVDGAYFEGFIRDHYGSFFEGFLFKSE